jgi:phosphatidylserine/phosphatidylglycerophosphate/cardiolipin synthase-like enzyme
MMKIKNQIQQGEVKLADPIFDFSTEVIPTITEEIQQAEKYVRIAMFQIHHKDIFRVLNDKLDQGLEVEIFTLPYDSINEDIRQQVESRFRKLEKKGAKIFFDKWNVGDPSRTTTAVGRWYSFHGKFLVTEKSAIGLSANFTQSQELDAVLIFRGDQRKIKEFNEKFDELLTMFFIKDNGFNGKVRRKITEVVVGEESGRIFELPEDVELKHKNHWIRHYPVEICQPVVVEEKLYITPFDCKGRDLITRLIENAEAYVYVSTESFTDLGFSDFLVNSSISKDVEIKILSGTRSMDFTDRINNMFRDLLAQEIDIKTTDEDIHAKLILTDKVVAVSSVNLNKINLGFNVTSRYWRENTESILVCKNPETIRLAKEKYLKVFDGCYDVRDKLSEKLERIVQSIFSKTFNLRSRSDVKKLFAKFILKRQVDVRKLTIKIGKITKKLMDHYNRTMVEKQDFISAVVLYYLSERKHDYDQLQEKLSEVDSKINLEAIVGALKFAGLIEQEDDYSKINVEALI